jgi:hypothetical protein
LLAYHTAGGEYVAHIDGTAARRITTNSTASVTDWSPDSTKMVMTTSTAVQIVNAATLAVATVPNIPAAERPTNDVFWSPDGTFLLYRSTQNGHAISISPTGTGRVDHGSIPVGPISPGALHVAHVEVGPDEVFSYDMVTGTNTGGLAGPVTSENALFNPVWRASGTQVCVEDAWFQVFTTTDVSGVYCGSVRFAHGTSPSVGGGTRPVDTDGSPPPATGLTATPGPNRVTLSWTAPEPDDAAGVQIRWALGTVAPTSSTSGNDAGRYFSESTATVTHLPRNSQVAISVFTLDAFGQAGPAASIVTTTPNQDATTIAATAVPFDVVYQQATTITGSLHNTQTGAALPNATVAVSRKPYPAGSSYLPLTTVTTNSAGVFTLHQTPGTSFSYRFAYPGTATHAGASIDKLVRVGVKVTAAYTRSGSSAVLTGSSLPVQPNTKAYLWRYVTTSSGPVAKLVGPHDTDAHGRVSFHVTIRPGSGTSAAASDTYRVQIYGNNGLISGKSPWIDVSH